MGDVSTGPVRDNQVHAFDIIQIQGFVLPFETQRIVNHGGVTKIFNGKFISLTEQDLRLLFIAMKPVDRIVIPVE